MLSIFPFHKHPFLPISNFFLPTPTCLPLGKTWVEKESFVFVSITHVGYPSGIKNVFLYFASLRDSWHLFPFFFSSFLLNPHCWSQSTLAVYDCSAILSIFPQLKESFKRFPFLAGQKRVVRVKLWHSCKVLCLHISSESLFPRFQGRLGGWL